MDEHRPGCRGGYRRRPGVRRIPAVLGAPRRGHPHDLPRRRPRGPVHGLPLLPQGRHPGLPPARGDGRPAGRGQAAARSRPPHRPQPPAGPADPLLPRAGEPVPRHALPAATRPSASPSDRPRPSRRPSTSSTTCSPGASSTRRSTGRPTTGRPWSTPTTWPTSDAGCAIIQSNPLLYERLAAALDAQLRLGGVFIADTDLFQRDVTRFLNTDIRPIAFAAKQLLRALPVYFNEVGAEGELALGVHRGGRDLQPAGHADALRAQAGPRRVVQPPGGLQLRHPALLGRPLDPAHSGALPLAEHAGRGPGGGGAGRGPAPAAAGLAASDGGRSGGGDREPVGAPPDETRAEGRVRRRRCGRRRTGGGWR